jgi:hypothetical protein
MPIGIVSDADLQRELKSYTPAKPLVVTGQILPPSNESIPSVEIIQKEKKGRKEGDVNVPDSLRAIIGEEALLNGRAAAVDLAGEFGISPSSASAYAVGSTSTASYNKPSSSILSVINKSRERATRKAAKTLNAALSAITQEKLDYLDADKVSGIAKDMSVIIKNLEPKVDPSSAGNAQPQFTIYAPQFRDERSFEFIQVTE